MADKLCETFEEKRINLITRDKLQKYIRSLEEKYKPDTVAGYFYVLRSIFEYCFCAFFANVWKKIDSAFR